MESGRIGHEPEEVLKRLLHLALIGFLTTWSGCAIVQGKESAFLRTADGYATQDEVRQKLGLPSSMTVSRSGEAIWIYRIWDWQPGNRLTAPGAWCEEYVLGFDRQTVLQEWTHESHFHGGEAFPNFCVPARSNSIDKTKASAAGDDPRLIEPHGPEPSLWDLS